MDRKIKIVLLCALAALVVLVAGFVLRFEYNINSLPPAPSEYASEITQVDNNNFIYKEKIIRYPAKGAVIPYVLNETLKVGLSVDKDKLDFGLIPQGLSVNKVVEFKNNDYGPAKVLVATYGNIKPFVNTEKSFVIAAGDNRSLNIVMNASVIGQYSGEIDVVMRVPRYESLYYLVF